MYQLLPYVFIRFSLCDFLNGTTQHSSYFQVQVKTLKSSELVGRTPDFITPSEQLKNSYPHCYMETIFLSNNRAHRSMADGSSGSFFCLNISNGLSVVWKKTLLITKLRHGTNPRKLVITNTFGQKT